MMLLRVATSPKRLRDRFIVLLTIVVIDVVAAIAVLNRC